MLSLLFREFESRSTKGSVLDPPVFAWGTRVLVTNREHGFLAQLPHSSMVEPDEKDRRQLTGGLLMKGFWLPL